MRMFLAVLALIGVAACGALPPAGPIVEAHVSGQDPGAVAAALNAARSGVGLGALDPDPRLMRAAQGHAADMDARGYFSHDTPEGVSFAQRAAAQCAGGCWMAENIARGPYSQASVVDAWMASPPHRRNILNRRAQTYGLGVSGDYWVLMLGGAC